MAIETVRSSCTRLVVPLMPDTTSSRPSAATPIAVLCLLVAHWLPESAATNVLSYGALGYLAWSIGVRFRSGYLRRRPHWTADSWRRYLLACSVPAVALLILLGTAAAVDLRLSFVGTPASAVRGFWVAGALVSLLVAAVGLGAVIGWMVDGDPTRQFTGPRWFKRRQSDAA